MMVRVPLKALARAYTNHTCHVASGLPNWLRKQATEFLRSRILSTPELCGQRP